MPGMPRSETPSVADAVRALAAPGSVLALVVLALNDHVLKQTWPGWVTGKLSDVAGLVFAPLLLAVLLTALRVPRGVGTALGATGVGFVLCKTSETGAAVTSAVWSLLGTPTMIRADVTDLVALPALYLSWRIHRSATVRAGEGWRRTASAAVGVAVLPFGVLATSATSCYEWQGYTEVAVLQGDFEGPPPGVETRLAAHSEGGRVLTIDAAGAFVRSALDVAGEQGVGRSVRACVQDRCWRLDGDDRVDASVDAGRTWTAEDALEDEDRERIDEELGDEECGGPPPVGATDIAAMEVDGDVRVVVALQRGGVWYRDADGTWTVLTPDQLDDRARDVEPPVPTVTELDAPDEPDRDVGEPADPDDDGPTGTPRPTCLSPTPTTVTPHPSNGPPTTYDVCP